MLRYPIQAAMQQRRRAGAIGGAGFSPLNMTAVAAVYEPDVGSTAFQELLTLSPTTPSVVGGVVGTLYDRSGNGRHISPDGDTKRPIWRAGVAGNYLEFDGVNDNMRAIFTLVVPYTRITLLRQTTWTINEYMIDGSNSSTHYTFQSTTSPQFTSRNGGGIVAGLSVALGTWFVLTEVNNGASSKVKINNGSFTNLTFGSTAPAGVSYAARGDGLASFSHMDFGGGIITAAASTDAEIAAAVTYLGAKQGLVI